MEVDLGDGEVGVTEEGGDGLVPPQRDTIFFREGMLGGAKVVAGF